MKSRSLSFIGLCRSGARSLETESIDWFSISESGNAVGPFISVDWVGNEMLFPGELLLMDTSFSGSTSLQCTAVGVCGCAGCVDCDATSSLLSTVFVPMTSSMMAMLCFQDCITSLVGSFCLLWRPV